jgi:hypothetical protein
MDHSSTNPSATIDATRLSGSENTPTPSRPSTPSNDPSAASTSKIPLHAGFDLNAIKNVLEEVKHESEKSSQTPSKAAKSIVTHLASPPNASPFARPQSTPPVQIPETNAHPRASSFDGKSQYQERIASTPMDSPQDDLTPSFSRSFSATPRLGQNDASSSYSTSTSLSFKSVVQPSFNNPFDDSTYSHSTRSTTLPSILADDAWGAPSSSAINSSSISSTKAAYSIPSLPSVTNQYTTSFADTTPTFSFGAADGTITGSSGTRNDPWSIPPLGLHKKKSATTLDGFNANPWS